ncbi:MAG TPA: primosomal protein N', partial [Flavobacteriales bacterium]|nr:primosomal protein N' [Flavobacteriales bacterium]
METTKFLNVLLPLALPKLYTYRVPRDLSDEVSLGKRVVVQFGRNKVYSALITEIHTKAPKQYEAKYILSVLDEDPIVVPQQLKLWKWMSSYYMCTQGEIMNAAFPSGIKLASETKIQRNKDFNDATSILSDKEYLVYEALEIQETLSVSEVICILN